MNGVNAENWRCRQSDQVIIRDMDALLIGTLVVVGVGALALVLIDQLVMRRK